MTSKSVALLLADLGVTKTHSRPSVSNGNPYSQAQFKTLKYRPDFPDRFGALEHARVHSVDFFRWYNTEHRRHPVSTEQPYWASRRSTKAIRCSAAAFPIGQP